MDDAESFSAAFSSSVSEASVLPSSLNTSSSRSAITTGGGVVMGTDGGGVVMGTDGGADGGRVAIDGGGEVSDARESASGPAAADTSTGGTPGDGGEGSVGDGGGERGGEDGVAMSLSPANGGEGAASLPAVAWEVMAA